LVGGLIGGGKLSAASHGTDHLIVQRLLASRSLGAARWALIGSGIVVFFQFLLFLLAGSAIWAAGRATGELGPDQIFPTFVSQALPAGVAGLVIAGLLAGAMTTISSSTNALAAAVTHDFYATATGRTDPTHLMRVGRLVSVAWGVSLVGAGLGFYLYASGNDTPVVVLALSIASVTYGALLGGYLLAGVRRVGGPHVIAGAVVTLAVMLVVIFARRLAGQGVEWLEPIGRVAWPWYVPMGTAVCLIVGYLAALVTPAERPVSEQVTPS
jgi:Na+/proline symporter